MENVNVSGEFGRKPTLEFTDSTPSDELLVEVLHEAMARLLNPAIRSTATTWVRYGTAMFSIIPMIAAHP